MCAFVLGAVVMFDASVLAFRLHVVFLQATVSELEPKKFENTHRIVLDPQYSTVWFNAIDKFGIPEADITYHFVWILRGAHSARAHKENSSLASKLYSKLGIDSSTIDPPAQAAATATAAASESSEPVTEASLENRGKRIIAKAQRHYVSFSQVTKGMLYFMT